MEALNEDVGGRAFLRKDGFNFKSSSQGKLSR
jgi:hypothetical protein